MENIQVENLFILVLIISANYMMPLYPCRFQETMRDSIILRHIFGLFTMSFFVTLTNPSFSVNTISGLMLHSTFLYLCFLIFIRTPPPFFIGVLLLLMCSYLISIKIKFLKKEPNKGDTEQQTKVNSTGGGENGDVQMLEYAAKIVNIISIAVASVGFIVYLGLKKIEYKKKFSYVQFFLGANACRHNHTDKTDYLTAFGHAFK